MISFTPNELIQEVGLLYMSNKWLTNKLNELRAEVEEVKKQLEVSKEEQHD